MEEWRPVPGFPKYEVSNNGEVRNSKTGRIMKTSIDYRGYETICLRESGLQRTKLIHRLVANAFLDNYDDRLDVIHRDNDLSNNCVYNLEMKTRLEHKRDTCAKQIICIETGVIFNSISECAEKMGTTRQAVSRCVNNPVLANKDGFHFKTV